MEGAFRGLRNPLESWAKSDSTFDFDYLDAIGPNDIALAHRMIKADMTGDGEPNSKFLRQIIVSMDLTLPLYVWKQFDTYKVGTVANSTSTMHKLASTPISLDCFETGDYDGDLVIDCFETGDYDGDQYDYNVGDMSKEIIRSLQLLRKKYLETKDKRYWKELIRWLPEGWLQTRTMTVNYATLRNIYHWRKNHKLVEWHRICDWIETLPYAKELICWNGDEPHDD